MERPNELWIGRILRHKIVMVGDNKAAGLKAELAGLQREQRDALENATYISMNSVERREYDGRALRITALQRELGIKPDDGNDLW